MTVAVIALPFSYTSMIRVSHRECWLQRPRHLRNGLQTVSAYLPAGSERHLRDRSLLDGSMHGPCGSGGTGAVGNLHLDSGVAPNRIFNIEYRTSYYNTNTMLNYEVRLF